jgi:large subunit ribosomal protein L10
MKGRSEPSEVKKKEVSLVKELIGKYKTIGLLDLSNLPSAQLQSARKKMEVEIKVVKKRLLRIAFKGTPQEKLEEVMEKITPALIMTNNSSFKLAKDLKKGKSFVAAKPGQIAPNDLIVKAGSTDLPAGPIIGELGAAGIKASVEDGKVAVKEDSVVVKSGEEISDAAAGVLAKLGIKPMEIGLNLVATCEDGSLFKKDVLEVDEGFYIDTLKLAVAEAMNLSVSIGYVTKDNINLLLSKVESEAKALEKVVFAGRDKLKKDLSIGDKEGEALSKAVEANAPEEQPSLKNVDEEKSKEEEKPDNNQTEETKNE